MAASNAADAKTLNDLLKSTLALLKQFSASLTAKSNEPAAIENAPNPLNVLKDSATLLKAHTTKVSLLAINKPFTPSAITKVLRELSGTCLPAMMSAVQICTQQKNTWPQMMAKEAQIRVARVFREMEHLLLEVQSVSQRNAPPATMDSLRSTGVVWESCDALIELEKLGVAGLAVQKAEQYRDSIKDAIEELQEWREGTDMDNEGEDDALLDDEDEGVDGDADSIDDIFNAANSCPKDRPELRELVEKAEGRLKKVVLLYTALGKRRFRTYKPGLAGDEAVRRLDQAMEYLKQVQTDVDELASCFYDLDEEKAKTGLDECVKQAKGACEISRLSWDGQEDEFTVWSKKWEEAVG
ncbi:hypothetical protein TI39_contig4189g00004 [Lecanosticta acicola]|uniref:Cyclin-D1-binding protein 1-like N-terminal domain-containing protein n=1 Tax=Lecanosticta acicola TaxID=111012 RepID=A0AAI8YSF2_9PEZI|nr:hypothetical protein TI39_contig4189g00004 [Lecanosticta acicola]